MIGLRCSHRRAAALFAAINHEISWGPRIVMEVSPWSPTSLGAILSAGFLGRFRSSFDQFQRGRIHAVTKSRRGRAIGEDVSQMGVATATEYFGAGHGLAVILVFLDGLLVDRLEKTGPAGPRVEFRLGIKERLVAANASINAVGLCVPIGSRKRALRPLLPRHSKLRLR